MANTFKNAALADVNSVAYDTLYTCPSATTAIILGVALANKTAQAVEVDVRFTDDSANTSYQLLENVAIPGKTTLEVLAGQKYVLEASDVLSVQAQSNSSIDVVLGLMEIT